MPLSRLVMSSMLLHSINSQPLFKINDQKHCTKLITLSSLIYFLHWLPASLPSSGYFTGSSSSHLPQSWSQCISSWFYYFLYLNWLLWWFYPIIVTDWYADIFQYYISNPGLFLESETCICNSLLDILSWWSNRYLKHTKSKIILLTSSYPNLIHPKSALCKSKTMLSF